MAINYARVAAISDPSERRRVLRDEIRAEVHADPVFAREWCDTEAEADGRTVTFTRRFPSWLTGGHSAWKES